MSIDDGGAILLTKPEEKTGSHITDASDSSPPVKEMPKGNEDRRCPRCKTSPNSMMSMESGKWMCNVCAYPEKDVRRNSDKRD